MFGRASSFFVSFNFCLDNLVGCVPMLFTCQGKSKGDVVVVLCGDVIDGVPLWVTTLKADGVYERLG